MKLTGGSRVCELFSVLHVSVPLPWLFTSCSRLPANMPFYGVLWASLDAKEPCQEHRVALYRALIEMLGNKFIGEIIKNLFLLDVYWVKNRIWQLQQSMNDLTFWVMYLFKRSVKEAQRAKLKHKPGVRARVVLGVRICSPMSTGAFRLFGGRRGKSWFA